MGFIAPSVWLMNEYGAGLRGLLAGSQRLAHWVDFGDYQVFEEAITYTALQFYRGRAVDEVACVFAPDGELGAIDWEEPHARVPYEELAADAERWVLAPDVERALLRRLSASCERLDGVAKGIAVGLQTSADSIYHLTKVAPGRYLSFADSKPGVEIELEDEIMRPLVSGEDAKRYLAPAPSTHLLFPYDDDARPVALFPLPIMGARFPQAWSYLQRHERALRARERGKFDDDAWYRFGRHQNLDKQKLPKLLVPRLTIALAATADADGLLCMDNVDVNGVLAHDLDELWFLLGVLNGPVATFAWSRGSKPFQHGYRAANKQFIAPLPIPRTTPSQRAEVAAHAQTLQTLHTSRRDLMGLLDRRLASGRPDRRGPDWLWEDVGALALWKSKAPADLKGRERTAWARAELDRRRAERLDEVAARLRPGVALEVSCVGGELVLRVDGAECVRTYVAPELGPFYLAQWRRVARGVTAKTKAPDMVDRLLDIVEADNPALRAQVVELDAQIVAADAAVEARERELDALLYELYGLTDAERELIEATRVAGP